MLASLLAASLASNRGREGWIRMDWDMLVGLSCANGSNVACDADKRREVSGVAGEGNEDDAV